MSKFPKVNSWGPVLEGEVRDKALDAILDIASDLQKEIDQNLSSKTIVSLSLNAGSSGHLLFFAYLDRLFPDRGYREVCVKLLHRIFDDLPALDISPSLYVGITGIAWAVREAVRTLEMAEYLGDEATNEIDRFLCDLVVSEALEYKDYDLIQGWVGIGVYAVSIAETKVGRQILSGVMDRLWISKESSATGYAWKTPEYWVKQTKQGQYNLGLAHGVPGVVCLLAAVLRSGYSSQNALKLLKGAVRWLHGNRLPSKALSSFSNFSGSHIPSRLGWCYGDLGVAVSLHQAGLALHDPDIVREAIALAKKAANRRGVDENNVLDACLCHGAAGVAHIFGRFFQASGDALFLDAARYWFNDAFKYRRPASGIGGFLMYEPGNEAWVSDGGFLTGSAGIGLALISASSTMEPKWDFPMLVIP